MATKAEADAALERDGDALLGNENVGHVAVVEREGEWILEVGVYDAARDADARAALVSGGAASVAPVPEHIGPSDAFPGIPVSIVQTAPARRQFTDRIRPAMGGDSLGAIRCQGSGSLGLVVTISSHPGAAFVLTNWHVLVDDCGVPGDDVLQPSVNDGGSAQENVVCRLEWSALTEHVDVALARVVDQSLVKVGETRCFGRVVGLDAAGTGLPVRLCGRRSDDAHGIVKSDNATVKVHDYPGGTRRFRQQLMLSSMSKDGDSGAVLLAGDRMVGLLFAGDDKSVSFANRADLVERALAGMPGGNGTPSKLGFS
jgi:hypothetical protein